MRYLYIMAVVLPLLFFGYSTLRAQTAVNMYVVDGMVKCEKIAGDMVFLRDGIEMLRICAKGDFLVAGKKVSTDMEVYRSFKKWIIDNKGDLAKIK